MDNKKVYVLYEEGLIIWHWNEEKEIYERFVALNLSICKKKIRVYENEIEWEKYSWCKQWKALEEKQQQIIFAVYGKDYLRELYKNEITKIKNPEKLYTHALRNLYLLGWNKNCTRCGGSGNYSYCQRFGTKCFKCDGNKQQVVTPTKAEIARLLKKYPEGIVHSEDYEADLIRGKGEYKKKQKEAAS